MALFHICQVHPNARIHVVSGYDEVAETVLWGLRSLGHAASYAVNHFRPEAVNIVLGAHNVGLDLLQTFRKDTIIYNLEQMYGLYGEELREDNLIRIRQTYDWAAANLTVWDYSLKNIDAVKGANPGANILHMPIAYAPVLERIPQAAEQDIDILFIGMPHDYRLGIYRELCERWLKAIFVCGLYGESRDGLIARAKLVMNISAGVDNSVFSIVRSSYFLANRKAVVADVFPNMHIERDIREAIRFAPPDQIAFACAHLLDQDEERQALADRGYEIFRQRDIRRYLMQAFSESALRS